MFWRTSQNGNTKVKEIMRIIIVWGVRFLRNHLRTNIKVLFGLSTVSCSASLWDHFDDMNCIYMQLVGSLYGITRCCTRIQLYLYSNSVDTYRRVVCSATRCEPDSIKRLRKARLCVVQFDAVIMPETAWSGNWQSCTPGGRATCKSWL